jgi:gluconokinase
MSIDVIVIAGICGCGKTTLAKSLANTLSWKFIEADDYHSAIAIAKMRAGEPLSDSDRWPWLKRLNESILLNKPAVLSCSALTERYRKVLLDKVSGLVIWLAISEEEASRRLTQRQDHFMPNSLVKSQLELAEVPDKAIILCANEPPDVLLERALKACSEKSHS